MADLDVALRLRLQNELKNGSRDARRDIDGIGKAAKGLSKSRGVDQLGRDIEQASARARRLERQLAGLRQSRGMTGLTPDLTAAAGSGERLARTLGLVASRLGKAQGAAAGLKRELAGVAGAAERIDKTGAGLRRIVGREGRRGAAGGVPSHGSGSHGLGSAPRAALMGRFGAGALGIGGGAYAVGALGKKAVTTYASLEEAAKALAVTADASDEQIAKTVEHFRQIGPSLGTTPKAMVEAAKTFVEAGLDYQTAVDAVVPSVKTAKASFGELPEVAKAGVAAINNLGIEVKDLPEAFDRMAKAGKEGNVELKNLARILPSVAAGGANLGLKGLSGLTDITSALEILGKVTATPDEAANRLENLFAKATADETVKNFKKVGKAMGRHIDLEKEMEKGAAKGESKLAVLLRLTKDLTKGNPFRINELFGDMQARQAVEALLKFETEYNAIRGRINSGSKGLVETDFKRAMDRLNADFEKLGASWDRLAGRFGEALAPSVGAATKELTGLLDRIEQGETALQRLATRYGLGTDDAAKKEIEDKLAQQQDAQEQFKKNYPAFDIDNYIGKNRADAEALRERDMDARRAAERAKTFARPDQIREQLEQKRAARDALLKRAGPRLQGPPGIQRDAASDQVARSASEIAGLESQLAAAIAAVEALKAERQREIEAISALAQKVASMGRLASFTPSGPTGEAGGPVGSGKDAFGFGPHGQKAVQVPLPPVRPQDLSATGKQTMDTYNQALKAGLKTAESEVVAAAGRMKTALSFTATPTITPRISAPSGGGGGGGGAAPASAPAAPAGGGGGTRSASLRRGGGNSFHGPIHVHGVTDVASLHRSISREADRRARDARNDALHDTGTDFA